MTQQELARAFFDRYVESFSDSSGEQMAQCYGLPSVMTRADGSRHAFTDREAMRSALRCLLEDYQARGARGWRFEGLEVHALGQGSMLASVTWFMLGADEAILRQWRHSYVLTQAREAGEGGVRIVAAVYNV